jgi:hypothetical protein
MTPTESRDMACKLAKTDPAAALEIARGIGDPWFRSQALAHVARASDLPGARRIFAEARAASLAADDPYQVVGSSAWWLRAMIELGDTEAATCEIPSLLEVSATIENHSSGAQALFLVLQAVFHVDKARRLVTNALIRTCLAGSGSWRPGRTFRDAAIMLAPQHPAEAEKIIRSMPEDKWKRRAIQRIEDQEFLEPRAFFW